MAISTETLAAAMAYVKSSLAGAGAVAGKPCQIQSITEITGGNRVTFLWEDNEGVSHTSTMDVMDGAGGTVVVANPTMAGTEANLTSIEIDGTKYKIPQGGGGGGTNNYVDLDNKPQVNGVTLIGNKSLADLGIEPASVEVIGTLLAGQTGITLSDPSITNSSTIDVYTDVDGVNPTGKTVASGSITLTFTARSTDLGVKVVIK